MADSDTESIPSGAQQASSTWGDYNNIMFAVQQALGKMQTATLVRIEACTNEGALSPVGFVDVTPLVNQLDAAGVPTPHTTIFNVPYLRVQGGTSAIIIDPVVGDIGMCAFASRDISKIKSTKEQGNPGSFRQFSFSDGMYLGGMLNGEPEQYVMFNADGIKIYSPTLISLEAPSITMGADTIEMNATESVSITSPTVDIDGNLSVTGDVDVDSNIHAGGDINVDGDINAGGDVDVGGDVSASGDVVAGLISLKLHTHTGGTISGKTGPPLP